MANDEEEELLCVIKDVKGFLKRSDGIPSYVSKDQLFSALTRIMKKPSVHPDKKVEAVDGLKARVCQEVDGVATVDQELYGKRWSKAGHLIAR